MQIKCQSNQIINNFKVSFFFLKTQHRYEEYGSKQIFVASRYDRQLGYNCYQIIFSKLQKRNLNRIPITSTRSYFTGHLINPTKPFCCVETKFQLELSLPSVYLFFSTLYAVVRTQSSISVKRVSATRHKTVTRHLKWTDCDLSRGIAKYSLSLSLSPQ